MNEKLIQKTFGNKKIHRSFLNGYYINDHVIIGGKKEIEKEKEIDNNIESSKSVHDSIDNTICIEKQYEIVQYVVKIIDIWELNDKNNKMDDKNENTKGINARYYMFAEDIPFEYHLKLPKDYNKTKEIFLTNFHQDISFDSIIKKCKLIDINQEENNSKESNLPYFICRYQFLSWNKENPFLLLKSKGTNGFIRSPIISPNSLNRPQVGKDYQADIPSLISNKISKINDKKGNDIEDDSSILLWRADPNKEEETRTFLILVDCLNYDIGNYIYAWGVNYSEEQLALIIGYEDDRLLVRFLFQLEYENNKFLVSKGKNINNKRKSDDKPSLIYQVSKNFTRGLISSEEALCCLFRCNYNSDEALYLLSLEISHRVVEHNKMWDLLITDENQTIHDSLEQNIKDKDTIIDNKKNKNEIINDKKSNSEKVYSKKNVDVRNVIKEKKISDKKMENKSETIITNKKRDKFKKNKNLIMFEDDEVLSRSSRMASQLARERLKFLR